MKKRGAWGNAFKFIGAATLLCGVLLLTVLAGAGKHLLDGKTSITKSAVNQATKPGAAKQNTRWAEAYGKLPMSFEENVGQTAHEVRYVSHGSGYALFLTPQEAVIALHPDKHVDFSPLHRSAYLRALRQQRRAAQTTAIRMHLEGANPEPLISGAERLTTRVNYFTGNDPKNWHTEVPAYARVKYVGVYPGVDLVFYGNQRRLEYDFVVAPGADPGAIQLKIDGARKMRINSLGDLVLSVSSGEVKLQKPLVYQQIDGEKREVAGRYMLGSAHRVTFSVSNYDRREALILDPVLDYSTYLGGSGAEVAFPIGIAVDGAGDAFVAGLTTSTDFPTTTNALTQEPLAGNTGASFVAELNPAGTQLLYSSYLVGTTTSPGDGATSVAVDSTGKVYVTGVTFASGFPSKNPLPYTADTTNGTCYVTKLDPTQSGSSSLVFSTYLGGTGGEIGDAIAVDANGNAYVVGQTLSTDFPVTNTAYQSTFNPLNVNNASGSAFLSVIDTTNSTLAYSTYLSGNAANAASATGVGYGDQAFGVAVDTSNNAYVTGVTSSTNSVDFPSSTNANQLAPPAANAAASAFVSKINTVGNGATSLVYSTYIAGSVEEQGLAITLGPQNIAYVTGLSNSNDFPTTAGAFDTSGAAGGKAFVSLVDTTKTGVGNSLTYSTYLGGTGGDTGFSIKADSTGNAYVVGTAASADFPGTKTLGALLSVLPNPNGSAFVAKLFPGGNGTADLLYSTYFGGSGDAAGDPDQGYAIAIDSASPPNAYITGQTSSANIPILTPLPGGSALNGPSDAYVAKLALIPTLTVAPSPFNFGIQPIGVTSAAQAFQVTNNTSSGVTFNSIVVTGVSPAANTDFVKLSDGCSPSVAAGAAPCTVKVTFTPSVASAESATLVITAVVTNGGQASTDVFNVNLSGTGSASAPAVGLSVPNLTFNPQMVTTTSTAMPVTLTNTGNAPLAISSIAGSGDFAETNNCPIGPPNTLPATAGSNTCTINVTITPTAVGARAGTLTITDDAGGSPQTIPLSGTGWDFSITAPSSETGTSPLMFNATMTPLGGFNQSVGLTCIGAPAGTTCTVMTPVMAADGQTAQTAQVTLTGSAAMIVPPSPIRTPPISMRQIVPLILALMLFFLLPRTKRLRMRLGLATAIVVLVVLAGCSNSGKPVVQPIMGNLTIKGTSTGTAGSVSHSSTTVMVTLH